MWYQPSPGDPRLGRLSAAAGLCDDIVPFFPGQFLAQGVVWAFWQNYAGNADLIHVTNCAHVLERIKHRRLVWDIDGLPSYLLATRNNEPLAQENMPDVEGFIKATNRRMAKCRRVFVSSETGTELFTHSTILLRNCITGPSSNTQLGDKMPKSLLFVGGLVYGPNVEALNFFDRKILPLLRARIPDLRITVVGRSPKVKFGLDCVKTLKKKKVYDFHFDVPDCTPFLNQAGVSIAPILSGDGTRIKIIEAFAHNSPVVSTTKGCEGLDVVDGKHLLIADTAEDFANACLKLLNDPQLQTTLQQNAHSYFQEFHSQEAMDSTIEHEITRLL